MKHYVGVKIIQAEPMTHEEYCKRRNQTCALRADGQPIEGYRVFYPDGYESWSPKGVFEKAYLPMGEQPDRVTAEMVDAMLGGAENPAHAETRHGKLTVVEKSTVTGFLMVEGSGCVNPENYDEVLGAEIAMKRIRDRVWGYLGFIVQWGRDGLKR